MAISKAYERCLLALTTMVRGTGSIQERLRDAFLQHLRHIDPESDLTPALAQQFLELKALVTSREPEADGETRVEATTRAMSDHEAQETADQFIAFATNVAGEYHDQSLAEVRRMVS
ncbi:MAG: hypothetical protein KatS3mg119_0594 [Rhodothalassiaceae bacterium]|nr:MAG: hypothetical protein KatS3mg119_0594 [Rhodothalassiaceae bacterium]